MKYENIPKPDFKVLPQAIRIYFVRCIFDDLGFLYVVTNLLEMSELTRLFWVHFEFLEKMRGEIPMKVLFQYLIWSYINWFPSFSGVVEQIKMKIGLKYGNIV